MEEPLVTAVEYEHTPTSAIDIAVERLEFGKFCISPDGPIESNRENIPIEHSQLGWSDGFPEELISICYPTKLGIVQEDGEALPRDNFHGTVTRPIVRGPEKRIRQVFYRVRARAEEGEGESGRRYTLARYLVVPGDQVNPLTMLAAMESEHLAGITRAGRHEIFPLKTEPAESELDHVGEAFLRKALIYILSGVPLSITGEISETKFFTWVAAVHDRLPPALRPHLSAGWNVGSSYSGKLGITYTAQRAANTAHFSPSALKWSSPECVTTWNAQRRPVVNRFFEERLDPGRLFEQYMSTGETQSPAERLSTLVGSLPAVGFPELPGWDDPGTVRILRYPGLQADDQFAITALAQWLKTEENDDSGQVCLDARKLTYQSNRLKALRLILQALQNPDSRSRGDLAFWRSVEGKIPASFTTEINASGSDANRALLLAALACGDVSETLRILSLASPEETECLPDEVRDRLFELLDKSLQPNRNTLPFHQRMLPSPSTHYRQWVEQHALELMSAFASQEGTPDEVFTSITKIDPSESVKVLHRLITSQPPTSACLSFLGELDPDDHRIFVEFFDREWNRKDEQTRERRTALLSWFPALQFDDDCHPLLRLMSGSKLSDADVEEIADDVEANHVPDSMLSGVAALALERWAIVGQRIVSTEGYRRWVLVTRLWPTNYARVLGSNRVGTQTPDPQVSRAASNLTMSVTDLQRLVTARFLNETFNGAAPLVWDLAMRLEPHTGFPLRAVDLCRGFVNGQLPDEALPKGELTVFIQLVRESGHDNLDSRTVQKMWESASRYWQVRLLLTLFRNENLHPSPAQLSLLIPYRDWLSEHLLDASVKRRNLFTVATQPFHGLSSKKSAFWNEEFVAYPIWAAFSGVPVGELPQEALRKALRAYSGSNITTKTAEQSQPIIEQQAEMCCKFLDSASTQSQPLAVLRVLREFLLPLLSYQLDHKEVQDTFNWIGAVQNLPDYKAPKDKSYTILPDVEELMRRIVRSWNQKELMPVIRDFYKTPKYASRDRH